MDLTLPTRRTTLEIEATARMKASPKPVSLKSRASAKADSRRKDQERLDRGEQPEIIQEENSVFPSGYFERNKILNFASAIGR